MTAPIDRWWESTDPAPVTDEWTARQVISFHESGEVPCSGCTQGLVCPRLAQAHTVVAGARAAR